MCLGLTAMVFNRSHSSKPSDTTWWSPWRTFKYTIGTKIVFPKNRHATLPESDQFLDVCRASGDGFLSLTLIKVVSYNMVVTMKNYQIYNWNRNSIFKETACHPPRKGSIFWCVSASGDGFLSLTLIEVLWYNIVVTMMNRQIYN